MSSITFIAAGPYEWGSSRMRAYWISEGIEDSTVIRYDPDTISEVAESPIMVWQKFADLEYIKAHPQVVHLWDVCDPLWWWSPVECREIVQHVGAVIFSSHNLELDFATWCKSDFSNKSLPSTYVIPDRLKLSHFKSKRVHRPQSPVRLIWFGVAVNRIAIYAAVANLDRLIANGYHIELTIFDDRPEVTFSISNMFPIYHIGWNVETEPDVIASHDIALLPPYPGPWGSVKSNNKDLTAKACGLPVSRGIDFDELESMVISPEKRRLEALFPSNATIDISIRAWRSILDHFLVDAEPQVAEVKA